MKKFVALFTCAALAFGAVAPIHAQVGTPYIPSVHHGYDRAAPANAFAKDTHKRRHHHQAEKRAHAQVIYSDYDPIYGKTYNPVSAPVRAPMIHEWEDQGYHGWMQFGGGN